MRISHKWLQLSKAVTQSPYSSFSRKGVVLVVVKRRGGIGVLVVEKLIVLWSIDRYLVLHVSINHKWMNLSAEFE